MITKLGMGKKRILLRFVETMDFIYKKDRPLVVERITSLGRLNDFSKIRNPARDGGKQDELGFRMASDDTSQCRFSCTGWPPKDNGGQSVGFDRPP